MMRPGIGSENDRGICRKCGARDTALSISYVRAAPNEMSCRDYKACSDRC